ncbi:MAG: thiamine pyrophosphate-binding protein [Candidatus Thermoplasmatota archaeon]|nr:thiamine pyrophosphate-binding protein [Candidatus Thermoplasmatota archaeon]
MFETVAEAIVDYLAAGGVERIYGVPGDSIDPLVEAIRRKGKLTYVQVRHEEGGAFAASFDAKFNGRPSACFGTSGPGSIHLLNGLYDAKFDKAPVIAITGQVRRDLVGRDYHQEVNMPKLFDDVSVFNRFMMDAESASYLVSRAVSESVRLGGVSHLSVPVDVLMERVEVPEIEAVRSPGFSYSPDLDQAARSIEASRKPVLLVGSGCRNDAALLSDLSLKIGAPVIYALLGKGILSDDDPKVMGGLGLLGTRPSVDALEGSDLIIEIGTTFPYTKFIPKGKRIIQVDIDSGNLSKEIHADVPVHSDARTFMTRIMNMVMEKEKKYYAELEGGRRDWEARISGWETKKTTRINPAELARVLSEETAKDAVIVTDTGNSTAWIARHFRASSGQRFLFSGGLASMGCALPGALGVSLSTGRQVVSVIGDGGFSMTSAELSTIRKYGIPVKMLLFNNGKLGMIKFEQEVLGYPEWGVDLVNPDFSVLASAYGIESMRIERGANLRNAIRKTLDSDGPFLLEAITDPGFRPMPPHVTMEQAKGYLVAGLREHMGYTPEIRTE